MIEMHARLYCDRCDNTIAELFDVEDMAEVEQRLSQLDDTLYALDEDGNDVCAACWRKWDAEHPPSADSAVVPIRSDA